MSKIEKYNLYMYPSIKVALEELMAPHTCDCLDTVLGTVYTKQASTEVSAFLCFNDIPHTFIEDRCTRLGVSCVLVSWDVAGEMRSLGWWEKMED